MNKKETSVSAKSFVEFPDPWSTRYLKLLSNADSQFIAIYTSLKTNGSWKNDVLQFHRNTTGLLKRKHKQSFVMILDY